MILTRIHNEDGSVRYVKVFINGPSDHRALKHNKSITGFHVKTHLSEEAKRWLDDNDVSYTSSPTFSDAVDLTFYKELDAVAFKLWFG